MVGTVRCPGSQPGAAALPLSYTQQPRLWRLPYSPVDEEMAEVVRPQKLSRANRILAWYLGTPCRVG